LLVQRLVQLKDPSVLDYVEPLAKLLEPFEWKWKMERRPKDLGDLRRALEVGKQDLDGAMSILIGWVGEAKATEGSLVDARSIDVNELAFLDLKSKSSRSRVSCWMYRGAKSRGSKVLGFTIGMSIRVPRSWFGRKRNCSWGKRI
jgi:hypothetical protein